REVVIMHALEREYGDQRGDLVGDLARELPDSIEADDGGEWPEQIKRVDGSGETIAEVGDPPRQRRMLPVAELPFLAEREILDEIELQVRAGEDRQDGPDREMQRQHAEQHGAGSPARESDEPVEEPFRRGGGDLLCHGDPRMSA